MKFKLTTLILISFLFARCAPGKLIGSSYLVNATKTMTVEINRFATSLETDQFLFTSTGLQFKTDSLIGNQKSYFEFRNGDWVIYVEKQLKHRLPSGKTKYKPFKQ
jgi:hypothetical protein